MRTVTIKRVVGTKPAPPGHLLFNAPRPLYGTTWQGDFEHGIFYAAVDPVGDPYAANWIKRNVELDGWLLEYITEADIEKWGREQLEHDGIDSVDYEPGDLRDAYWATQGQAATTLEALLKLCSVGIDVPQKPE